MKFEWDSEKNKRNNRKHRVDFSEAETVFEDDNAIEIFDEEHSEDEDRFIIMNSKLSNDAQKAPGTEGAGSGI